VVEGKTTPTATEYKAKITLITAAQIEGLKAKQEFILNKLKAFKRLKYEQFCDLDTQCREKMHLAKEAFANALDEQAVTTAKEVKKCRTDFIDKWLQEKELVKGQMEDLLNETVHQMKELKVEAVLGESGIPTEKPKTQIDTEIATLLMTFDTEIGKLYT